MRRNPFAALDKDIEAAARRARPSTPASRSAPADQDLGPGESGIIVVDTWEPFGLVDITLLSAPFRCS